MRIFSLAKYNSFEILIEEQLLYAGSFQSRFFENYKKNQEILRKKVFITKILSSLMFTILPIIPLLTYFQINHQLTSGIIPSYIVTFTGSLLFSIYFVLQFFNFFLLGMFNTTMIISGNIFKWYETLPLPREKLRRIVFLTIFRSLDIPIITSIITFPIIIFIGTLNLGLCLICFFAAILNTLFSFSILIFFGVRINRILNINEVGSKKTHLVRLFHMFSYIIIIMVSVYSIQFSFSSIESIFNWFVSIENPSFINIILSLIPYPFNLSYIVALFIAPEQVPLDLWINVIIGLALLILLIWLVFSRTLKSLEKVSFSKYSDYKKLDVSQYGMNNLNIRLKSPTRAYITKDFLTATRDLKTLMSFIMPIILSYIFTISYNLTGIGEVAFLESYGLYDWLINLGFQIIISGMIVFSLLNMEESGETIIAALPIVPRERARAKLFLMIFIQIISVLTPPLFLLFNDDFYFNMLISLGTLPFASMFLMSFFLLRINYFGKIKNHYVLEEVLQEKKSIKWAIIYLSNLFIFIWIFTLAIYFYYAIGVLEMGLFLTFVAVLGFIISILIFDSMFPKIKIEKIEKKVIFLQRFHMRERTTWLTAHPWISSIVLLAFYFIFGILANYIIDLSPTPFEPYYYLDTGLLFILFLTGYNLIYGSFFFLIVPLVFGLPFAKKPISLYLKDIGAGWLKKGIKYIIWILIAVASLFFINVIIYIITYNTLSFPFLVPELYFNILQVISEKFWREIVFRGLILTMLLNIKTRKTAIFYGSLISAIFNLIPMFSAYSIFPNPVFPLIILLLYYFVNEVIIAYIFTKTRSIIPGLIINIIMAIVTPNLLPSILII